MTGKEADPAPADSPKLLSLPAEVSSEITEQEHMDAAFTEWLASRCYRRNWERSPVAHLYSDFAAWYFENGHDPREVSPEAFGKLLRGAGIAVAGGTVHGAVLIAEVKKRRLVP